jgi:AraC-like DNA-binding protein
VSLKSHLEFKGWTRQFDALQQIRRRGLSINRWPRRRAFRTKKSFIRAFRHWTGQSPAQFRLGQRPLA